MREILIQLFGNIRPNSRQRFTCPDCSETIDAEVPLAIDAREHKQTIEELLEINPWLLTCSHCGHHSFLAVPVLYTDEPKGVVILAAPEGCDDELWNQHLASTLEINRRMAFHHSPSAAFPVRGQYLLVDVLRLIKDITFVQVVSKTYPEVPVQHRGALLVATAIQEVLARGQSDEPEPNEHGGNGTGLLPWPLNLNCVCGESLVPHLYCCDRESLILAASFNDDVQPGYRMTCEQCKEAISGFFCGACGTVHTWDLGLVESHPHSTPV